MSKDTLISNMDITIKKENCQISFGDIWRFFAAMLDFRTMSRTIRGLPTLDVAFISNARHVKDLRYFGKHNPKGGFYNGLRYWLGFDVVGRIIVLDCLAEALYEKSGVRRKAKDSFLSATKWSIERGAKIILLAAGTKRLFGADGENLKKNFSSTLFTIGDNGTVLLLIKDIEAAFQRAKLLEGSKICVIGPSGFLGEASVKYLISKGYDVVGVGLSAVRARKITDKYGIDVFPNFSSVDKVDAVVSCSHARETKITELVIKQIKPPDKKLLVVDVSEPPNLDIKTYRQCQNYVVRIDAGDAYIPRLHYVLGRISSSFFGAGKRTTFGCFAESMALAWAIRTGYKADEIKTRNWFEINIENMQFIEELFGKLGITIPSQQCFGKLLKDENFKLAT